MAIKPILFNTEMVRAILDGRKSCTRRVVKFPVNRYTNNVPLADKVVLQELRCDKANFLEKPFFSFGMNLPYQPGDILYVRETWCRYGKLDDFDHVIEGTEKYYYLADGANPTPYNCFLVQRDGYDDYKDTPVWRPSIHMPKEAARIWLKVADVRVERLQEITEEQACMEGTDPWDEACYENNGWHPTLSDPDSGGNPNMIDGFHKLWDSTIKKNDLDRYSWNANPWVWVIEFERCEKPKEEN